MMKNIACALTCAAALAAGAQESPQTAETTLEQQTDVSVTAYNNDIALVRDVRKLDLPTGELQLRFSGVAQHIKPETVSLRALGAPESIVIYEQNYEYDLISPAKLMDKYVGKQVRLIGLTEDDAFGERAGTLLSNNEGPVFEINGEIYIGHPGTVVLPELPENLIARPSLIWQVGNNAASQEIEVSYLTNGIGWKADYVVSIPRDSENLDLSGWVTLNNHSGATYNNAKLKLVAGEVNRVAEPAALGAAMRKDVMMMAEAAPPPQEEAFSEYHLYTMPRRTTLKENQSKQLALLDAADVTFTKKYEIRGDGSYWYNQGYFVEDQHAAVYLEFENSEENGMGMPLPGGIMRVYEEDSEGTLQFSGEDRIQHTPKNEEVSLKLGEAFDIVYDRKQTEYQRISDRIWEMAFEVTVRNRKEQDISVEVLETVPGDWTVLEESVAHEKRDAFTLVFPLDVPKDGEVTLAYRVRITV